MTHSDAGLAASTSFILIILGFGCDCRALILSAVPRLSALNAFPAGSELCNRADFSEESTICCGYWWD